MAKAKRTGLGNGLEALIPKSQVNQESQTTERETEKRTTLKEARQNNKEKTKKTSDTKSNSKNEEYADFMVSISKVEPNKSQPRKEFNQDALEELAASIKEHGIIQPLVVVKNEKRYEIVSGERRWRAAKIAGLKRVPVVIKNLSPQEIMEVALIENLQREDLNPMEEAAGYQTLMTEYNLKQEEVAKKVGKSRTAVANSVRLLKLDASIQNLIVEKKISMGHARALLGLDSFDDQYDIAMRIIEESLSVRETEELIHTMKEEIQVTENKEEKTKEEIELEKQCAREYKEYENNLNRIMGTKVRIKQKKNNKGKIEIEYFSLDEFERIYHMLQVIPEGEY